MENTNCSKNQRGETNALKDQSSNPSRRVVVVSIKLHCVSDNANNTEAV